MFENVCKQTFHISHVHISQKVKGDLVWNLWHIIFIWSQRYWQIFKSALVYLQDNFLSCPEKACDYNSVVKTQNLVVIHESQLIKSNPEECCKRIKKLFNLRFKKLFCFLFFFFSIQNTKTTGVHYILNEQKYIVFLFFYSQYF